MFSSPFFGRHPDSLRCNCNCYTSKRLTSHKFKVEIISSVLLPGEYKCECICFFSDPCVTGSCSRILPSLSLSQTFPLFSSLVSLWWIKSPYIQKIEHIRETNHPTKFPQWLSRLMPLIWRVWNSPGFPVCVGFITFGSGSSKWKSKSRSQILWSFANLS